MHLFLYKSLLNRVFVYTKENERQKIKSFIYLFKCVFFFLQTVHCSIMRVKHYNATIFIYIKSINVTHKSVLLYQIQIHTSIQHTYTVYWLSLPFDSQVYLKQKQRPRRRNKNAFKYFIYFSLVVFQFSRYYSNAENVSFWQFVFIISYHQ